MPAERHEQVPILQEVAIREILISSSESDRAAAVEGFAAAGKRMDPTQQISHSRPQFMLVARSYWQIDEGFTAPHRSSSSPAWWIWVQMQAPSDDESGMAR